MCTVILGNSDCLQRFVLLKNGERIEFSDLQKSDNGLAFTMPLDKEKDEKHIFDLASGGFSSTVRLAKSNADMWIPILTQNRDNVLQVMDTYIDKMQQFREAVAGYDEATLRQLIEEANRIKKIIR